MVIDYLLYGWKLNNDNKMAKFPPLRNIIFLPGNISRSQTKTCCFGLYNDIVCYVAPVHIWAKRLNKEFFFLHKFER